LIHPLLVLQNDAASPTSKPGVGVLWIVLVLVAVFVAVILPRLRRRRDGPQELLGSFGGSAGGAREELERLLTEIQDLSREHIARLDTKIRMLNQLLLECDQKKRELETLLGKAGGATTEPAAKNSAARASNPLHDQVYSLQDSGKEILDICAATGLEKGEVELILGLRKMN
jgi:type II secretory pathway component PulM